MPTTPPNPTSPPDGQQPTPAACAATTRSGAPCRFPPRKDTSLCVNHDPAYREAQASNRRDGMAAAAQSRQLRAAERRQTALYNLDTWALADRASIQAILDAVIRLELAGRLPNNRARNLLRALAIAVRNFDTPPLDQSSARTSRHNLNRYRNMRQTLDQNLESLLAEAETRDHARSNTISPSPAEPGGKHGQRPE